MQSSYQCQLLSNCKDITISRSNFAFKIGYIVAILFLSFNHLVSDAIQPSIAVDDSLIQHPNGHKMTTYNATLLIGNDISSKTSWKEKFPPLNVNEKPIFRTFSVIFAAHNEQKYLIKTIRSIYRQTPSKSLHEVIIVDDASDPPLVNAIIEQFPNITVLQHTVRQGLIRSKVHGANYATGDIIVYLDAHVKVGHNWWIPMLEHVNLNYKRVVVPIIPNLNETTWMPSNEAGVKMMFDWKLNFQWFDDGNEWVPIMSGGLLAITRRWYHESGEYDTGMLMWGGENIEQSLRIWLCGGEIVVARKSVISHVFRAKSPYVVNITLVHLNHMRTIEVWFDEYKHHYYEGYPHAKQYLSDIGDLSERIQLKKDLKCNSFEWFIHRFKEQFQKNGMLDRDIFQIVESTSGLCAQADGNHLRLNLCDEKAKSQLFFFHNGIGGLQVFDHDLCLDANAGVADKNGMKVLLYPCYKAHNENQVWSFTDDQIRWKEYYISPSVNMTTSDQKLLIMFRLIGGGFPPMGKFLKRYVSSGTHANKVVVDNDWRRKVPWQQEFPPLPLQPPSTASTTASPIKVKTISVIFAAIDEHKYIIRTIGSIYKETPPDVLAEIIVVDDASSPHLAHCFTNGVYPNVIILRHTERQGLIKSKTHGASVAVGDVIMFLDAHVKVEPHWWVQILEQININYKRVVVPIVAGLNEDTWMSDSGRGVKNMFDWTLSFQWFDDGNEWVPIMSGGLLGLSRRWWHESGEYDTGMGMWGGENIEQSLRIWLCGGEIVVARRSIIGHVFRPTMPYSINVTQIMVNKIRAVEVWFDEYKVRYYTAVPTAKAMVGGIGDITSRIEFRKQKQCKPFQYFVDKFRPAFDMKGLFSEIFQIREMISGRCVQAMYSFRPGSENYLTLTQCASELRDQRYFLLNKEGIKAIEAHMCLDSLGEVNARQSGRIGLYHCMEKVYDNMKFSIGNGEIRWQNYCGYITERNILHFRNCPRNQTLTPTHRFEIFDPVKNKF